MNREVQDNDDVLFYTNYDMDSIVTPVKIEVYEMYLHDSGYSSKFPEKAKLLIDGFKHSFDLGYEGDEHVKRSAQNLKIRIGTEKDLWNKVMKEVKLKRYAGPL